MVFENAISGGFCRSMQTRSINSGEDKVAFNVDANNFYGFGMSQKLT